MPKLNQMHAKSRLSSRGADTEQLFFDGKNYFDSLTADIDLARDSIDFETYIFEMDETGHRVLTALERAAKRGVRVRLLVDGFGARHSIHALTARLGRTPVQFRAYRLIPWDETLLTRQTFRYVSRRNHRKTCLIDGHSSWIGSFNVSDVHTKRSGADRPWRDTAIHIRNHGFPDLTEAFERAWDGSRFHRSARAHFFKSHFLLNCTTQLRQNRNRELANHIRKARRRVWVTTPYFSPDHKLIKALKDAAAAGADVRLLLPERPDVPGMSWVNSAFYKRLFRSGLKIYLYRSSVLHAKTIVADDWAIVGSSNLNHRSLFHDLEVDAIVTAPASLEELEKQFNRDIQYSRKVVSTDPRTDSRLTQAIDRLAILIRGWT